MTTSLIQLQDDVLLAIVDRRRITRDMLVKLPPWRASLLANVAERAHADLEVTAEEVHTEATRVGGAGVLWSAT